MINVVEFVPVDNKARLLRGGDGATSKGGVNVKGSNFGTNRGIDDEASDVIEHTPIACEKGRVNTIIDRKGSFLGKDRSCMTLHLEVEPTLGTVPNREVRKGPIKNSNREREKGPEYQR